MENLLNAITQLNTEDRKEIYEMLAKEFGSVVEEQDFGFNF